MNKISLLLSCCLIVFISDVLAQVHLPDTSQSGIKIEKKDFPLIIRSICRSAIKYPLDQPGMKDFEKARNNFYGALNCLYKEARHFSKVQYDMETAELVNPLGFNYSVKESSWSSPACFGALDNLRVLKSYSSTTGVVPQNIIDFKDNTNSLCIDGRDFTFKSCAVMEVFYNELCGYQEFLYWRMANSSVNSEDFGGSLTWDDLGSTLDAKDYYIEKELVLSQKFIDKLISDYTNYEVSYKTHSRLIAIEYGLKLARSFGEQMRRAIQTWPAKFINASSEICEQ